MAEEYSRNDYLQGLELSNFLGHNLLDPDKLSSHFTEYIAENLDRNQQRFYAYLHTMFLAQKCGREDVIREIMLNSNFVYLSPKPHWSEFQEIERQYVFIYHILWRKSGATLLPILHRICPEIFDEVYAHCCWS